MGWLQNNGLAILFFLISTIFGIGVAYANIDTRLHAVEKTVTSQQQILHKLEKTMIRLETVTERLERIMEKK